MENLSKEELINKVKSLLNIAKKAKQSKDGEFKAEQIETVLMRACKT